MSTPSGDPSENKTAAGGSSSSTEAAKGGNRHAILYMVAGLAVVALIIGVLAAVGGGSDEQDAASGTAATPAPDTHGEHADGHDAHAEPSSTVPPPPITTPGPALDAKLAAAKPLSNVDAKAMMDKMATDWAVGFGRTPQDQLAELTEQMSAIRTDGEAGLITRVSITWGKQDGKLRRLSCSAIDTKPQNGAQIDKAGIDFIYDCAQRGVEGAQRNALKAWIDANLTGDALDVDRTGKEPVNKQGSLAGGVRVEAVGNPGIAVNIYGPGA